MVSKILYSSATDDWSTPQELFDKIQAKHNLTIDVAASDENHKLPEYYTKQMNGLELPWDKPWWCNPPYGRGVGAWVQKAYTAPARGVMLLPARTDTKWFHDYIWQKDTVKVDFLKGRLKFGNSTNSAPFPSMLVYFKGERCGQ